MGMLAGVLGGGEAPLLLGGFGGGEGSYRCPKLSAPAARDPLEPLTTCLQSSGTMTSLGKVGA